MRILFAFTGGRSHVEPLLPLAHAAAPPATGSHSRAVLDPPCRRGTRIRGLRDRAAGQPPQRLPLQPLDPEREAKDFRDGFVLRSRERAAGIHALVPMAAGRPRRRETHYGAVLAAERLQQEFAALPGRSSRWSS